MAKGGDNEEDGTVVRNTYALCGGVGWSAIRRRGRRIYSTTPERGVNAIMHKWHMLNPSFFFRHSDGSSTQSVNPRQPK